MFHILSVKHRVCARPVRGSDDDGCVAVWLCAGEEPRAMPWYLKLQWLLYNIVTTGSLMVTAWYWAVLYKSKDL